MSQVEPEVKIEFRQYLDPPMPTIGLELGLMKHASFYAPHQSAKD